MEIPIPEELFDDAPALRAHIDRHIAQECRRIVEESLLRQMPSWMLMEDDAEEDAEEDAILHGTGEVERIVTAIDESEATRAERLSQGGWDWRGEHEAFLRQTNDR